MKNQNIDVMTIIGHDWIEEEIQNDAMVFSNVKGECQTEERNMSMLHNEDFNIESDYEDCIKHFDD